MLATSCCEAADIHTRLQSTLRHSLRLTVFDLSSSGSRSINKARPLNSWIGLGLFTRSSPPATATVGQQCAVSAGALLHRTVIYGAGDWSWPGRSAKNVGAVVAVARKLAVLLHRLWSRGEVFSPPPQSQSAAGNEHRPVNAERSQQQDEEAVSGKLQRDRQVIGGNLPWQTRIRCSARVAGSTCAFRFQSEGLFSLSFWPLGSKTSCINLETCAPSARRCSPK